MTRPELIESNGFSFRFEFRYAFGTVLIVVVFIVCSRFYCDTQFCTFSLVFHDANDGIVCARVCVCVHWPDLTSENILYDHKRSWLVQLLELLAVLNRNLAEVSKNHLYFHVPILTVFFFFFSSLLSVILFLSFSFRFRKFEAHLFHTLLHEM